MICGACAGELAAAAIAAAGIVRGKCLGNRCTRQQIGIGGIESGNDVQHRFCRGFSCSQALTAELRWWSLWASLDWRWLQQLGLLGQAEQGTED
jgi:hypothetical protein